MKLNETIEIMNSADYKERFIAEYHQTKIRYEKLKKLCDRIEVEKITCAEELKHDCFLELLKEQHNHVGMYLSILENII